MATITAGKIYIKRKKCNKLIILYLNLTFSVHECLFCPRHFKNAAEKDDHILEHFAQETCTECNQNLIRIGSHLYTLHNAVTCTNKEWKADHKIKCEREESDGQEHLNIPEIECNSMPNLEVLEQETELKPVETDINDDYADNDFAGDDFSDDEPTNVKTLAENDVKNEDDLDIILEPVIKEEPPQINDANFTHGDSTDNESDSYFETLNKDKETSTKPENVETPKKFKHNDKGSTCDICQKTYFDKNTLRRHRITTHSDPGTHFCKICARIFKSDEELTVHKETCLVNRRKRDKRCKVQVECNLCGQIFASKFTYNRHMKHVHSENRQQYHLEKSIVCDVCGKNYFDHGTLQQHKKRMHVAPGTLMCRVCLTVFEFEEECESHQKECRLNYYRRNCIGLGKTFECYVCKKILKTKPILRRHMRSVHDPDKVQCQYCGKQILAHNFQRHHDAVHLNIRNFICNVCGQAFKSKRSRQFHMYRHSGEKPYECTYEGCTKRFTTPGSRIEHLRKHTGEKPFQCDIDGCDKKYAYGIDFRRHKMNKHGMPAAATATIW